MVNPAEYAGRIRPQPRYNSVWNLLSLLESLGVRSADYSEMSISIYALLIHMGKLDD
jgi:hypothetical protein